MLRLVMMGTGEFAIPAFRALLGSPHAIVGLFTQPDRTGRGHHHHPHPMKETALASGVPVFQPEKVNAPDSLETLRALAPDLCVVAAYGQILSARLLAIPKRGAINIHASLLPKYRGAAPIQYAIRNGETETGITIFQIEPKLDAGGILSMRSTPIGPDETAGELHDRLAAMSAPQLLETLERIENGTIQPVPQSSEVTLAPRLNKAEGIIDWNRSARQIHDHLRAMTPWPRAFTWMVAASGEPHRLLALRSAPHPDHSAGAARPGEILRADSTGLLVATGEGVLQLLEVQPEGKRAMAVDEFLRGHPLQPGDCFSTP